MNIFENENIGLNHNILTKTVFCQFSSGYFNESSMRYFSLQSN